MTSQWRHRHETHSCYSELNFLQNVYFEFSVFGKLTKWRCFCNLFIEQPLYITNTNVNSACRLSGVSKLSTGLTLARVEAGHIHLYRVAGNTVWSHMACVVKHRSTGSFDVYQPFSSSSCCCCCCSIHCCCRYWYDFELCHSLCSAYRHSLLHAILVVVVVAVVVEVSSICCCCCCCRHRCNGEFS